jgi:hypothetical protein
MWIEGSPMLCVAVSSSQFNALEPAMPFRAALELKSSSNRILNAKLSSNHLGNDPLSRRALGRRVAIEDIMVI